MEYRRRVPFVDHALYYFIRARMASYLVRAKRFLIYDFVIQSSTNRGVIYAHCHARHTYDRILGNHAHAATRKKTNCMGKNRIFRAMDFVTVGAVFIHDSSFGCGNAPDAWQIHGVLGYA